MNKMNPQALISHWQIAADGIWEQARELSASPSSHELQGMLEWVGASGKDIAIEAFFGNKLSEDFCFFGVRLAALSKEDQKAFIRELAERVAPSDTADLFLPKFQTLLTQYTENNGTLSGFGQAPDFLELGAEGFWKSYGSYVVWKKGEGEPKSIDDIRQNAPQLLRPFERAIMMEQAWKNPLPMWLAQPVSRKTAEGFVFDEKKYRTLAAAAISCP